MRATILRQCAVNAAATFAAAPFVIWSLIALSIGSTTAFADPDLALPASATPLLESCALMAKENHGAEGSKLWLAHTRSVAGAAASVPVIVPIGILEVAAWIPPVLIGQTLACAPALILDVGTRSGGSVTSLCLAFMPAMLNIPDLALTSYAMRRMRSWRRIDIGSVVAGRMDAADCYATAADADNGDSNAPDHLEVAYAELEKLILDDRFYKVLTPVQLDEVDSRIRALKLEIDKKKRGST